MAFEKINVIQLKNSINNSLSAIDYSSSKEIINKIKNNDIWSTSSRDNFARTLDTLVNKKYLKLENKLKTFLEVANKIGEYQELSKLNVENQAKLNEITLMISNLENDDTRYADYSKEIEELDKNILENETRMEVIVNTINNNLQER